MFMAAQDNHVNTKPLSMSDADKLLHEPSAEDRGAIVNKIAGQFMAGELTDRERTIANQIFRLLLNDVEVRVRRAMAEALRDTPLLPHDIALALARDLSEVAAPILQSSEVLTDDDLVEIIRNPVGAKLVGVDGDPDLMMITQDRDPDDAKHLAIARRSTVSWRVSAALVENGNEDVAVVLVENDGADLTGQVAQRVVDRFGSSSRVQTALIDRTAVPVTVMERLAFLVSDKLRERLIARHKISSDLSARLTVLARERTTMELLGEGASEEQIARLVRQLWKTGRLTPTIILRAICTGETQFFQDAMARSANMTVDTVNRLLREEGGRAFDDLFRSAGLPGGLRGPLRAAVDRARELLRHGAAPSRAEFTRDMINGVMSRMESDAEPPRRHDYGAADLEFVLSRLAA